MGNDIDVLSQDTEIDEFFWRNHGPKNESTLQFFRRGFNSFCERITSPKRSTYTSAELQQTKYNFQPFEYDIESQGVRLSYCKWLNQNLVPGDPRKVLCVVYLHTNTRNLSDALEVLPFCEATGAHLFAMDLPGAGKSDGILTAAMANDLSTLMDHIGMVLGKDVEVVLWARGMSTGIAIEYIAREIALEEKKPKNIVGSVRMNPPVVFCVLDTPFESIKLMIDACMKKLKVSGYDLPDTIVSLFSGLARRTIASRVKADPYAIEPIQYARNINIPCTIMIAENDDYIPVEQCLHIAEAWKGVSSVRVMDGGHFGQRPVDVVIYINEIFKNMVTRGQIGSSAETIAVTTNSAGDDTRGSEKTTSSKRGFFRR